MSDDGDQEETVKYGDLDYWEERYGGWAKSPYDWLFEWKHVRHVVQEFVQRSDLIMLPGCGNAPFSAHMYKDGFKNQINIDTSTEAIKTMLNLHSKTCPKAEWLVKDATATGYPDEHFDAVVDKSLVDTTVCADDGQVLTHRFVGEMHRILKTNGLYITMSLHTWEEVRTYFKPTANLKTAAAAIVVNNPDFHRGMRNQEDDMTPELKCFVVCKKLHEDATPEEIEREKKRLENVLAPYDDSWLTRGQVANKEGGVADKSDGLLLEDEKAPVDELKICLRRVFDAQTSGALTKTECTQIKDILIYEGTRCTVDAVNQVLDEKEGPR